VFLALFVFLIYYLPFWLVLPLFVAFVDFCGLSSSRWPSWSFLSFLGLLDVFHGILDSNFKLCIFIVNGLIKGEIEKSSGQFFGLIVMSHWLGEVWIRIRDSLVLFFFLPLFRLENHVCLSRGVQVAGAAWRAVTRTMTGVGDLVQRIGDGRTGRVLGGWAVERSGGAVCGLHLARGDEEREFLDWAFKPRSTVCECFGLKTTRTVFTGLASKLVVMISSCLASKPAAMVFTGLASKPVGMVFSDLASKPVGTVSSGLASKPAVMVFSGLASKPVTIVFSSLTSKLVATVSPGLASKSVVGFLFEHQNQGCGGFFSLGIKSAALVWWFGH
jgi:hypothetical protein